MPVIDVEHLEYSYGRIAALTDVTFSVPEGSLYALLGPNGSGKSTLLQVLMGLRRAARGRVEVLGVPSHALTSTHREQIGYIAEGQPLPGWMRLEQLEAYLAPLYPTWDQSLARELRNRFALDPVRKIGSLSRGEHMKAALLCALAPRPRLLLMDEPFTGMDVIVKDELVRGLLESAGSEGWTVLLCSHDIAELELLADWVGLLDRGRIMLSEPMDTLHSRFRHVEIVATDERGIDADASWLAVERSGNRLSCIIDDPEGDVTARLRDRYDNAVRIETRGATLREVFVALGKSSPQRAEAA